MPSLIYFVSCGNAIVSDKGTVSIIEVVERIDVAGNIPSNAAADRPITAVAHFRREPDDGDNEFELRLRIVNPSEEMIKERLVPPFRMQGDGHRYLITIPEFPLYPAGVYHVKLSLRTAGNNNRWKQVADFPIDVVHSSSGGA